MSLRQQIKRVLPLLMQEEPGAIDAAQHGDVSQRQRVATSYLFLVWQIAAEHCDDDHVEEAIAEGTVALLRALDAFDPTAGKPFAKLAGAYVRCRIQEWSRERAGIRRLGNNRNGHRYQAGPEILSLDEVVSSDDSAIDRGMLRHEVVADDQQSPESEASFTTDFAKIRAAVFALPPSQRAAIEGRILGITPATGKRGAASVHEARALVKLRKALAA